MVYHSSLIPFPFASWYCGVRIFFLYLLSCIEARSFVVGCFCDRRLGFREMSSCQNIIISTTRIRHQTQTTRPLGQISEPIFPQARNTHAKSRMAALGTSRTRVFRRPRRRIAWRFFTVPPPVERIGLEIPPRVWGVLSFACCTVCNPSRG